MRRWAIAGVLALAGGGCSLLSIDVSGQPPKGKLRATCADIEQDACVAESVTLSSGQLRLSEADYRSLDRRPVPVRCVLRETGAPESCQVLDTRGEYIDGWITAFLEARRYQPVTYQGRAVLVPYTFVVSFAPPASEAPHRRGSPEVFRALLQRLPVRRADGGVEPGARCLRGDWRRRGGIRRVVRQALRRSGAPWNRPPAAGA
jgi:hypothetical protein